MSDTVFVHAGLAKTGTTTLQQNIFSKTPAVAYLGKNLVPDPLMAENRKLTRLAEGRFDAAAARAVYDAYRGGMAGVPVFSDEDLSVWKFLDPQVMGARLAQVFPGHRLIYVPRKPADWVVSQYFFRLWTWRPDTLAGLGPWLAAHMAELGVGSDVAEIRFAETLRRLHQAAGGPEVLVLPYELMVRDVGTFLAGLEHFMGLDGELRALAGAASQDPKKVRIAPPMANYIRAASLLASDHDRFLALADLFAERSDAERRQSFDQLRGDPDAADERWIEWLKQNERCVRRALTRGDEALARALDLFDDYQIPADMLARIDQISSAETAAMRRDFGVDLSDYGYGG